MVIGDRRHPLGIVRVLRPPDYAAGNPGTKET
jgi:hypothetical protein